MTNITLTNISTGYNVSRLNDNFSLVENSINFDALHREGGNNVMRQNIDMNSNYILNLETDRNDPNSAVNVGFVEEVLSGGGILNKPQSFLVAASDEESVIDSTGVKLKFRAPYEFNLTEVRCSLNTGTTGTFTVDVKDSSSTSLFSTKPTFDASEKTTKTASTQPVLSLTTLTNDEEYGIYVDNIGGGTAVGLKVTFIGTPA